MRNRILSLACMLGLLGGMVHDVVASPQQDVPKAGAAEKSTTEKSASNQATPKKPTVPELDSEFFNDYTDRVTGADRIQIRRTLRESSRLSGLPTMMVVINKMSDYPELPAEPLPFATALVNRWKKDHGEFAPALLIMFALQDHKFAVAKDKVVPQQLSDKIKTTVGGRVSKELRNNNISRAMRLAAEAIADTLPDRQSKTAKTKTPTVAPPRARQNPMNAHGGEHAVNQQRPVANRARRGSGLGWIIGLIVIAVCVMFVTSLFRGARRGYGGGMGGGYYGGGGGGRGGSFLGGMVTGGLLGYMFGGGSRGWGSGYDSHDNHSGIGSYTDDYSGGGGGGDYGGGDYGGGFDSFDGGGFDGGGSFGEW